ncbi:MAG: hypothetical protein ACXAC7_03390 [Candidatus Hodarchaeales archaeon]|jgi:TIM-barrel protein
MSDSFNLDLSLLSNPIFSSKSKIRPKNLIFLAAISGFTSGDFALKSAEAGAGAVSIGGLSLDKSTFEASERMRARGRSEFSHPPDSLINWIFSPLEKLEELEIPVFINVRFLDPVKLESFLCELPFTNIIIELNAHCRQPEMCKIGAGQEFCSNIPLLKDVLDIIPSNILVSLKIRGNDNRMISFVKEYNKLGGDILHVDAYQEGLKLHNMSIMEQFRDIFKGFLIANNSITASVVIESLKKGINAFSIARRAQFNPKAPYDLWLEIKNIIG